MAALNEIHLRSKLQMWQFGLALPFHPLGIKRKGGRLPITNCCIASRRLYRCTDSSIAQAAVECGQHAGTMMQVKRSQPRRAGLVQHVLLLTADSMRA